MLERVANEDGRVALLNPYPYTLTPVIEASLNIIKDYSQWNKDLLCYGEIKQVKVIVIELMVDSII